MMPAISSELYPSLAQRNRQVLSFSLKRSRRSSLIDSGTGFLKSYGEVQNNRPPPG